MPMHKSRLTWMQRARLIQVKAMPNLPQEIVEDILSRLPVKSLLRFKCVCKPWNSLISSTRFINMHLNRTTADPNNQNNESLFFLAQKDYDFQCYTLDPAKTSENGVVNPEVVEFPSLDAAFDGLHCLRLIGSCKGLILAHAVDNQRREALFLLNPSIRESKKLPDLPPEIVQNSQEIVGYKPFGFGYDYTHDDYKVLRIAGDVYDPMVVVYTLKSNGWRVIGTSPYKHITRRGILLNGVIHWIDCRRSDNSLLIASFDLSNETFQDIPLPSSMEGVNDVGILGGCLCVIQALNADFPNVHCYDVWVMREYGVRESWTTYRIADLPPRHPFVRSLCFLRNCIVFLRVPVGGGKELVLYDSEKKTFVLLLAQNSAIYGAVAYVESLVSPNLSDAVEGPH